MVEEVVKIAGKDFRIPPAFWRAVAHSHHVSNATALTEMPLAAQGIRSAGSNLRDVATFIIEVLDAKEKAIGLPADDEALLEKARKAQSTGNKVQQFGRWLAENCDNPERREPLFNMKPMGLPELTLVREVMDSLPATLAEARAQAREMYDVMKDNPMIRLAFRAHNHGESERDLGGFKLPAILSVPARYGGLHNYDMAIFHDGIPPNTKPHVPGVINLQKLEDNLAKDPQALPQPEKVM